jgi:hypothetical protein
MLVAMALSACGGEATGPPAGEGRCPLGTPPWLDCKDSGERNETSIASGCSINSDCNAPLVCAFQRCHVGCKTSRDCEAPSRCVVVGGSFNVCQLAQERVCNYNTDCASSQICATDGNCRDQCVTDRDCVAGQLCTAGACTEASELDGG